MAEKNYTHHQTEDDDVSQTKATRFLKIIFNPRAPRLRIPDEFMRRHRKNMRNPIFLRVPTGSQMEVELLIHGDGEEAWLQKGWPEFRDYHSIGFGQVLVFEYNGNSAFDVVIFDMSACEIEYPNNTDERTLESDVRDVAYHRSKENGYDIPSVKKGKVKKNNLENNPLKREMKKRKRGEEDDDMHSFDDCTIRKSSVSKNRRGLISERNTNPSMLRKRVSFDLKENCSEECSEGKAVSDKEQQVKRVAIDKAKSIAYQRATASMSNHSSSNPTAIVLLQPSYVSKKFHMNLPLAFAKENISSPRNDLTLRVSDGKTWAVKCSFSGSKALLSSGWKVFVEDNHLKLGDVCVFQAVKGSKLLFNVFIFRNEYPDNTDERTLDSDVRAASYHRSEENGSDSNDSVLFFEDIPSVKKRKVKRNNLENNPLKREMKKRKQRGKEDNVHSFDDCTIRKSSVSENRRGLISERNTNPSMRRKRVSFDLKEDCSEECNEGAVVSDKEQQVKRKVVDKEKSIAYQRATASMSNHSTSNPTAIVLLQPSYVSKNFNMILPLAFAKANLNRPRNDLSLRVSDGKTWAVRCNLSGSKTRLSFGWRAFVKDNHLKLGDVCVFQLVKAKGSKLLFNVFIFRNE